MDDLIVDFIAETRETLEALSSEIVVWEARPADRTRLDSIFRFFHTVKGSCGFLNLPRLEMLSHAAEDVLSDCREERRQPDAEMVSAVLAMIDRIGQLTEALATGETIPDEGDAALVAALQPGAQDRAHASDISDASIAAPTATPVRGMIRSIRLPVDLLDHMIAGVSDMVLARNDLARRLREGHPDPAVDAAFERLSVSIAEMRASITRARMSRIENLFTLLPRMVRDLSAELGKNVALEIDGGDVELDREMIEMIRDPLIHIVRNAIDHGIESPGQRIAAGKAETGRLRVSARQSGNQIVIEVIDDGIGIDAERLVEKAVAQGLVAADIASTLSWDSKLQLIFEAGISTASAVTAISGRGVGMDVVRANIERIGGVVDLDSKPGQGLRLSLKVPLTLTIIPALTVSAGALQFAIPRSAIEELIRVGRGAAQLCEIGGAWIVNIRGRNMPVVKLSHLLGVDSDTADTDLIIAVLKPAGGEYYALAVDAVHDHEELVVKPAPPVLMAAGIYAGTTLPDNSHPMLLLDPAGIARVAGILSGLEARALPDEPAEAVKDERVPTLLFRDLDGVHRAIRLSLVERIEEVPAAAVRYSAGRMRVVYDERIIPLISCGAPLGEDRHRLLRMSDGTISFAYAIAEVIDIVAIDFACERAAEPGLAAGVTLIDGRPVELIDSFWLFGEAAAATATSGLPGEAPLCLLTDGDDPWSRQVLQPLLRSAGYRVTFRDSSDAACADIVLMSRSAIEETMPLALAVGVPVIRLSTEPDVDGPDLVYRYDRARLLDLLEAGVRRRRASV